jgi:O-antigen/teichoic acid export membrane protein
MFSKGLWGYLPANILQGLIGFATLMVFTRVLSPDDYGRYALTFGISSLAQTIFFTWIEAAMARFYPAESRTDREAPELYGTLYRLFAIVAVVFTLICALGLWLATRIVPGVSVGGLGSLAAYQFVQWGEKSRNAKNAELAVNTSRGELTRLVNEQEASRAAARKTLEEATAQEQALVAYSVIRCASIWPMDFRCSLQRKSF